MSVLQRVLAKWGSHGKWWKIYLIPSRSVLARWKYRSAKISRSKETWLQRKGRLVIRLDINDCRCRELIRRRSFANWFQNSMESENTSGEISHSVKGICSAQATNSYGCSSLVSFENRTCKAHFNKDVMHTSASLHPSYLFQVTRMRFLLPFFLQAWQ